jgi:CPA1 family monovalent cation:H+ antiporter
VLIFKAALTLDVPAMKKDILHVLMLSFPVFVCITLVTGLILYFAVGHPDGFSIVAAMLAAALLSATDPAVAISTLEEAGTSSRVRSLLEGESLFNDAIAIVLFSLLLSVALNNTVEFTWYGVVWHFIGVFVGGILIGLVMAWITHFLLVAVRDSHACTIVTLVTAYTVYILAEDIFHVSGVMAVLAAGLLARHLDFNDKTDKKISDSLCFWDTVSELSGMMIFLLAGVTITLTMFTERWLAMLYAVVAIFLVRIALVIPALTVTGKLPWTTELGMRQQLTVCWGGTRGTITLALALSLPLSLDYYYTIQSMAYGVVLFT